jgi:plastocyanin
MSGTRLTTTRAVGASLLFLTIVACDKGTAPPKHSPITIDAEVPAAPLPAQAAAAAPAEPSVEPVAPPAGSGKVVGTIKFSGAAPEMPALDRSRDSNCPQDPIKASWVSVGAGGALRDAVVHFAPGSIKNAPPARAGVPPTIDQKGCLYKPYVVGLVKGQKLRVKNSDPTAHNVRAMNGDDQLFNEMHIAEAPDKVMPVDAEPGNAVQLKCDIHPWMETWVYVSDNNLFAITGSDGKFSIEGVPPGTYELEVWHPHLGKKTVKISVKPGETTTASVPAFSAADYKAPNK